MRSGFVESSEICESCPEVVMGNSILWRVFEDIAKQNKVIVPQIYLTTCNKRKSKECANCNRSQGMLEKSAAQGPFCRTPHDHDEYCNQGDIGIAVCHGLAPHLNKPNHRNQCAQVPAPANQRITPIFLF